MSVEASVSAVEQLCKQANPSLIVPSETSNQINKAEDRLLMSAVLDAVAALPEEGLSADLEGSLKDHRLESISGTCASTACCSDALGIQGCDGDDRWFGRELSNTNSWQLRQRWSGSSAERLEAFNSSTIEDLGSGRLQLARDLVDPRNPLTARVLVNRLWHHLLGRGIVATTDDFGVQGQSPTHPELLDYLASRLIEQGWSVKRMVRTILHSSTFNKARLRMNRVGNWIPIICGFRARGFDDWRRKPFAIHSCASLIGLT